MISNTLSSLLVLYCVWLILNVAGTAFDFDWFDVRSNSTESCLFNTRLSKLHFVVALFQWQTLYSDLRLIFGRDPFKVIRLLQ